MRKSPKICPFPVWCLIPHSHNTVFYVDMWPPSMTLTFEICMTCRLIIVNICAKYFQNPLRNKRVMNQTLNIAFNIPCWPLTSKCDLKFEHGRSGCFTWHIVLLWWNVCHVISNERGVTGHEISRLCLPLTSKSDLDLGDKDSSFCMTCRHIMNIYAKYFQNLLMNEGVIDRTQFDGRTDIQMEPLLCLVFSPKRQGDNYNSIAAR